MRSILTRRASSLLQRQIARPMALRPYSIHTVEVPDAWLRGRSHHLSSALEYESLHHHSITKPEEFWCSVAGEFDWRGEPLDPATCLDYNIDRTKGPVYIKWFAGSTTNLAHNCLDRQINAGLGDNIVFHAERNDKDEADGVAPFQPASYTYSELRDEVNRLANVLRSQGETPIDAAHEDHAHPHRSNSWRVLMCVLTLHLALGLAAR